jgi:hypothetical protein
MIEFVVHRVDRESIGDISVFSLSRLCDLCVKLMPSFALQRIRE